MSSESKKLLVSNEMPTASRERPSGRHPPRQQRAFSHETDDVSDDVSDDEGFEDAEQYEVYDDDISSSLIAKMHDLGNLLVNATRGKAAGIKKPRKSLKSALTPVHPSRVLADDKHEW